jgi:hypothetical protein
MTAEEDADHHAPGQEAPTSSCGESPMKTKMMRMRVRVTAKKKTMTVRVLTTAIQNEHNLQPWLLPDCSILHRPEPVFRSTLQILTLPQRVLGKKRVATTLFTGPMLV